MTRDHLLGFPALLRQHDEPAAPKKPTVKERPAAFVAFETGVWAPKMTMGVDPGAPGGDKTSTMTWGINGPIWDRAETRVGPKNIVLDPKPLEPVKKTHEPVQRAYLSGAWETREVTFDDVFDTLRKFAAELGESATKDIFAEFGIASSWGLKPEQWAEFIATAERRLAGWVKWSGGKQPVADLQMVEIRFRAWPETKGYAGNLGWWWHREEGNRFADIVEYRVIK